jgi:hypothetical protein
VVLRGGRLLTDLIPREAQKIGMNAVQFTVEPPPKQPIVFWALHDAAMAARTASLENWSRCKSCDYRPLSGKVYHARVVYHCRSSSMWE